MSEPRVLTVESRASRMTWLPGDVQIHAPGDVAPLTAGDDHWKKQPRDGEGQWTAAPGVGDAADATENLARTSADGGTRSYYELSDDEEERLRTAWKSHFGKLLEKHISKNQFEATNRLTLERASDKEIIDAVRSTRADAEVDDVDTAEVAKFLDRNWYASGGTGGFHDGLVRRVTRILAGDESDASTETRVVQTPRPAPAPPPAPPPDVISADRVSQAPPIELPTLDRDTTAAELYPATVEQGNALYHYSGMNFESYTRYLRGQTDQVPPNVARNIAIIRGAMQPSPRDATLFRYVEPDAFGPDVDLENLQDRIGVGSEYVDRSFVSTAVDMDGASNYSSPVLIQIEAPAGTPMTYIGESWTDNDEDDGEMLLRDGLRYRVVGLWQSANGRAVVRVRVVPDE